LKHKCPILFYSAALQSCYGIEIISGKSSYRPALLNKTSGKIIMEMIDINMIDPSLFQHWKLMSADKLRELVASIMLEGLIETVVLRGCNGRFQIICGERRFRAVKEYTDIKSILSRVIRANDWEYIGDTKGFRRRKGGYAKEVSNSKMIFVKPLQRNATRDFITACTR
jgi:hypothetical protein